MKYIVWVIIAIIFASALYSNYLYNKRPRVRKPRIFRGY